MTNSWQIFWSEYGPEHADSEDELFMQVAQTRNKQPIPKETFKRSLDYIEEQLKLSPGDHLVDLCCGNGLISYELALRVARVTGIDFVPRNIHTAMEWKSAYNITYVLGDVTESLSILVGEGLFPNKFLMNGSLAYFEPSGLDLILSNIAHHLANRPYLFLLTSIPCFDLKWNFYDTPERVARHLENEKKHEGVNDGVGRWWKSEEIEEICTRHKLQAKIANQPLDLSNYRMDALIQTPS